MKLFVWEDVLHDYGSGIAFVIAEDVDQARALFKTKCPHAPREDIEKEPDVYDMTKQKAFYRWGSA